MDPEENEQYNEDKDYVELYSKNAIRGFSLFFSPIFGGVLLSLNLWRAGFKQAVIGVMAFCVGWMLVSSLILTQIGGKSNSISVVLNLIGGFILSDYFFRKYFPEEDYYPRSIWKPLIVSLLIVVPIVWFTLKYAGPEALGLQ
ncbi:hypothetical protein DYU05_16990 [Mucilaginibacter terrenus]|uniref:Uncharacterized protein n=1 Tax=Mucilaginibacter terrenus TaxID=2482727 RepID=A0A3E2NMT4_9SPHI|nr:hypothetical protein [Mucilaginibacter terrenus]RFZ82309.1 hypothetical protein DYU05_16990 [Mucilaginibacter terrenus]